MDKGSVIEIIKQYIGSLEQYGIHCERAILFGSFASGKADKWSDIDINVSIDGTKILANASSKRSIGNDVHQLLPMIEETEANTSSEGHPKKILADSGYASAEAYRELPKSPHIDAYVPTRDQVYHQRKPVSTFDKSNFKIDLERLAGVCPLGLPMRFLKHDVNKSNEHYINFIGVKCSNCSSKSACTKSRYRNISVYVSEPIIERMRQKMRSVSGRWAMRIPKQTVEPVFGILKEQLGFRRFRLRGLSKVNAEFALLCSAFNLRKLQGFLGCRPLAGVLSQIRISVSEFGIYYHLLRHFLLLRRAHFVV